ncbi:MAG: hypothetical protein AUJ52_15025 [Elusimicrobia bacterium CG1_02_63_36]|nr:MAG: hypothetical protein AUJ52_15025 [Elusimicrobia bacterium CG1_02_63_36]PIP84952.1 MAG: hypothetical protein COR54_01155 [Elusimicrobia bacterium CG22_combo_CG10-13_8_21_14_all_63_91]PJA12370.1 MAG: hypothetical protein COX66_17440 [Elusimicrobia bacterium CG_4_10_14_0_2_um_filter_63_34]PJB26149.1 MAG: hypothetical protein CO113_04860 [Elusimicrobia bacterium CG_4_9_14_3_um_filter_62_55]
MGDESLYAEIGGKMRALREAQKRTQAEVAEASGIEASFYGQIERGANVPSLKTLLAVSAALGVGPAELLPIEGSASGDAYARVIESLMKKMTDKEKRALVGIVKDIATQFGYRGGGLKGRSSRKSG